ncbi:uncharacterized protein LOC111679597 [Lucilia cuprina]|uniref:uncharacterized protein LOC111679597 n=1 Tax=Lucilia cuprina TaxID=7375 RepID=UPI000C71A533|nr:uncharacterized protein LOC111679597 [Lucilia cuprina]XP_037813974.1 uncharacterized protein LOC119605099 [Lucilia sericata]
MSLGNFGRIAVGWTVITVVGVYSFVISKNSVDKRRYEDMQIRERMKKANIGDYESVGTRRFNA